MDVLAADAAEPCDIKWSVFMYDFNKIRNLFLYRIYFSVILSHPSVDDEAVSVFV